MEQNSPTKKKPKDSCVFDIVTDYIMQSILSHFEMSTDSIALQTILSIILDNDRIFNKHFTDCGVFHNIFRNEFAQVLQPHQVLSLDSPQKKPMFNLKVCLKFNN